MTRPTKQEYFMTLAMHAAQRASCPRRKVGCIMVNAQSHIVSTGYNGPPSGYPNCTDTPCEGAKFASGKGLDKCRAVHGEINAKMQAGSNLQVVEEIYVTTKCCTHCTETFASDIKNGLMPALKRIYFFENYPHKCHNLLTDLGIEIINIQCILDRDSIVYKVADLLGYNYVNKCVY